MVKRKKTPWHTKEEKKIIKKLGGIPSNGIGIDGTIKGRPVEVRSTRKDKRFRIQKDTHRKLIKKNGSYIFVKNGKTKRVSAKRVSRKLKKGKWFKDRRYPHKFIKVKDIF
jgi:hypothetical protein